MGTNGGEMKNFAFRSILFILAVFLIFGSYLGHASQKCHNGKPLEFTGKYWMKAGSNVMNGFQFTSPQSVNVGKGFTIQVHPIVPYRVTMGINLILSGPGLPSGGRVINFSWANNQTMGLQTIKCKHGASEYRFEFYGGHTVQPVNTTGINHCRWIMCYDGPFEVIRMKTPVFPRFWEINIQDLIAGLKRCGDNPNCELNTAEKKRSFKRAMEGLKVIEGDEHTHQFAKELAGRIREILNLLNEAENIIQESGKIRNREERREMRKGAMEQLRRIREIQEESSRMVQDFLKELGTGGDRR